MRRHIPGHPKAERKARLRKGTGPENRNNADFIKNASRKQKNEGNARPSLSSKMKTVFEYLLYVCFSTTGRINRAWWWLYFFLSATLKCVIYFMIIVVSPVIAGDLFFFFLILVIILGIMLIYSDILVTAKRFQDTNRSARNILWVLFPFFGALYILIVCGFFKGTDGDNTYGEPSYLIGDWDSYTARNQEEKNK